MENSASNEEVEITPEIISKLKTELRRTGKGPQAILRGTQNSRPKGLNSNLVKRWLSGQSYFAEKEHLNYIQNLWASFPDKKEVWLALTDRKRKLIQRKLQETGLTYSKLFSQQDELPKGFQPNYISAYFTPSQEKIRKDYYNYILKVCEANKGKGYIPLTPEIQSRLQDEITRTGISPAAFMKENKKHQVSNFNQALLYSWLRGGVETLDKQVLNEVLLKYEALPTKERISTKPESFVITNDLQPIQTSDLEKMKRYRDILGILPGKVFENKKDAPISLTKHMVSSWLNRKTLNADPKHIQWVLNRCRELVKQAVEIDKR